MSLPEFLNEEQKQLYRRAYAFYSTVHKNFYMLVYRFPLEDGSYAFPEEIERIDGVWYSVSNGRYQTWEEYRTALLSVFTEGWFQEHMEGNPGYLIRDGKLLCLQADIGYNATFKGTGTNTFEQLEQTENRIDFLLIEHYDTYNPQFPKFDETPPLESDLEWGDDYSIARQITLVKTEAGWRFDVFSCEN